MYHAATRWFVGIALAAATVAAGAQSLPNARPAPGNEELPPPLHERGFRPQVNWHLECAGCHLPDGRGSRHNDVPRMPGFIGHFLEVDGGREFLVQVPGVSMSSYTDAQVANLLNWILSEGPGATSAPPDFQKFTENEVARYRSEPLRTIDNRRNALLDRMRAKGIQIDDGLEDRP